MTAGRDRDNHPKPMAPNMDAAAITRLCEAIAGGSLDDAAALARAELPFKPIDRAKRSRTDTEKVRVFLRDGFIDLYSGEPLVFPGTLRLLSHLLPEEIPYHPNWDYSECHMLFWHLYPAVDHVEPVARGGSDTTDNLVCTSMLRNGAKGHWKLEELGWRRRSPGSLHAWDGLLGWFMTYTSDETSVLEQRFIKQWHRAALRALSDYEPQDLPSSLRSYARD